MLAVAQNILKDGGTILLNKYHGSPTCVSNKLRFHGLRSSCWLSLERRARRMSQESDVKMCSMQTQELKKSFLNSISTRTYILIPIMKIASSPSKPFYNMNK